MMAETDITNVEPGATPTIVVAARTQLSWHAKMRVHSYNFYVFISLVSTKDERRAAFKKAKNNLKAKAEAGDTGAQNKLKGFTIDKMSVWTGPQNMGAFPTIKPGVQLPQDISGRIATRWNHMIHVLTKQGKQGVPPEFNTVLTTHASFQFLDKHCTLPGQEANSSQNEKLSFDPRF